MRGYGIVADRVVAFYGANPDSWFSKRLAYHLDLQKHSDLNAQAVREEMFAQLHATFNTPVGKEFFYDNPPDAACFLETVNADIAQNDTAAKGLSALADGGTPSRFSQAARQIGSTQGSRVLASRPQGDGRQRVGQVTDQPASPFARHMPAREAEPMADESRFGI